METVLIAGLILITGALGVWFFWALVGVAVWGYFYGEVVTSLKRMSSNDDKNAAKEERRLIREAKKRDKPPAKR